LSKPYVTLFAGTLLLYAAYWTRFFIGYFGDDGAYIAGAMSLLDGSFRALYQVNEPPQIHYLPGFSVALAPFLFWLAPASPFLKLIPLVVTLCSLWLADHLLSPWLSKETRYLTLILMAFNPVTAMYATSLMSEPFFVCLTLLSFVLLREILDQDPPYLGWLLGITLAWTMLTRPIGVLVGFCILFTLALSPRKNRLAVPAVISMSLWLGFLFRNFLVSGTTNNYLRFWKDDLLSTSGFQVLIQNAIHHYQEIVLSHLLHATPWVASQGMLLGTIIVAIWILLSIRGVQVCAGHASQRLMLFAVVSFTTLYLVVHGLWSTFEDRYVLPVLPFLLVFLINGLESLFAAPGKRRVILLGGLLLPGLIYTNTYFLRQTWSPNRPPESLPPRETVRWVASTIPVTERFCVPLPASFYLLTGRPGIGRPITGNLEEALDLLQRANVRYIVVQTGSLASLTNPSLANQQANESRFTQWVVQTPHHFHRVFENVSEGMQIYQFNRNSTRAEHLSHAPGA